MLARAVLIKARLRKPHTHEVGFVHICMFGVDGGVATQGIPSCRSKGPFLISYDLEL